MKAMPDDPTKQEQHVTELAGPDDRWVSVTDASRIARRQEHTIRSWIAQGKLAVNPQRVGINKKTRQVRLSDLVKLTPIIDPDAGIATDLGMLDLPSIPKQQQRLAEQMTVLQQEMTRQVAALVGQQEHQYQALTRRDEEQQQFLQQAEARLSETLRAVDEAMRKELARVLKLHLVLDDRVKAQAQDFQQAHQELSNLVARTELALRQALGDQVEQSAVALRRERAGLIAQTEQALRQESAETVEGVRKDLAGLGERMVSGIEERRQAHEDLVATIARLHAHTDQQFSQVASRLEPLETTLGQQQDEIQKQAGRVGQLETQLTGLRSTWQERAMTAEQEARQLRRDLDAQIRGQQALRKQLDEERKAREELARQVGKLLQQNQQKAKRHE